MEQLKQRRTPLRTSYTRTLNSLKDACNETPVDLANIEVLFELLKEKGDKLKNLDEKILAIMLEEEMSQEDYNKEFEACEIYEEKLISVRVKVKSLLAKPVGQINPVVNNVTNSGTGNMIEHTSFRYPELSLKLSFDGNLRSWLGFWNTFKKIHEDPLLDDHAKFVYLIQATAPKTKARDIVDSFPTTAENYPKVIEHLKQRFGCEETLIQVYVRDLLQLVLLNNNGTRKDFQLSSLYDSLETKLRALESLGVTEDKYASVLLPLVESCLPTELLRIWEREQRKSPGEQGKNNLDSLLQFLKNEVVSEDRIMLARTSFEPDKVKKAKSYFPVDNNVATAAELINNSEKYDKAKNVGLNKRSGESCLFCDKSHLSENCFKASSLSYEAKKNIIMKKGASFLCLRKNHISRNCKARVRCIVCSKRHLTLLCPNIPSQANDSLSDNNKQENQDSVMTSQSATTDVLLQTLVVRLRNRNKEKIVRAVIDTGSENSYLTQDVIEFLNYESLDEIKLVHKLFGGVETKETVHHKYKINLSSVDKSYACNLYCLDQPIICSDIRKVPNGPWTNELRKIGVNITDLENRAVGVDSEVKLLIGSDVAGKLYTGNIKILKSGPVAMQTHLGWTLMGKIPGGKPKEINSALAVTSLLLKESSLTDQSRHIPGKLNPADLPTRGCSAEQSLLLKWWEGPSWLYESRENWPQILEIPDEDLINSEKRKSVLTAQNNTNKPDLAPLTPAMFLTELRSSNVEDIDVLDNQELNRRAQYRQQVRDHLRQRFRIEYLGQLRQQTSRIKKIRPLAEGDVVLLESDTKKRAYWSLARILKLFPGKDGENRVAKIRTDSGELLRPIQILYHLELQPRIPIIADIITDKFSCVRTKSGRKVTAPDRLDL